MTPLRRRLTDAIALAGMRPPLSAPTGTTVRLRGKRVLVTGASSGIGEAGAELFARNGAEVIIVRPMSYVTLTIDHRAIDGAQTNAWLTRFVETIERWA